MMNIRIIVMCISIICLMGSKGLADLNTDQEINFLLQQVEISPCLFIRNNKIYSGEKALEHINKKYNYFNKKGKIKTAEDFVEFSASKSLLTGHEYLVQCPDEPEVKCADWMLDKLLQYRDDFIFKD